MTEIEMSWRFVGPGSADLGIKLSEQETRVHTTYVGDGLCSVLQSAVDLSVGSNSTIAFLPSEPSGTCLFFGGAGGEAYLQVVRFEDMMSEAGRWSGGRLQMQGSVNVRGYIHCVTRMAAEVLDECGGADAYSASWGGIPFPFRELRILRNHEDEPEV